MKRPNPQYHHYWFFAGANFPIFHMHAKETGIAVIAAGPTFIPHFYDHVKYYEKKEKGCGLEVAINGNFSSINHYRNQCVMSGVW
jgi:hypothetical protein